ncbi:MSHA biogenesis protein MshQ [Vibrio alginolyticus]|nr:MSHA biogenesis protein MshQ [Vibrio alginolyticus]EII5416579.1 MSHA biogenesis protein MshQ [Vibrio alginolyticus]
MKKIISSLLAVALFLFSSISFAAVNNNPQFEFGTVPADKCTVAGPSVTCDIEYQNSYSQPPLVFVMPTIDASRSNFDSKTTEYPSDLKIWSISSSKATIKQLLPPHRAACRYLKYNRKNDKWQCKNTGERITYVDAPMNDIDYLVMEPGVIKFDSGAMLVAGKVSSKHTFSNKPDGTNNISKQVNFINFGLNTAFSKPPGVLVQIQTRNNMVGSQPLWLNTIALDPTRTGFSLIIDRSEVTKNAVLDQPEEVAFVAGYGEGFTQGRKFWLGNGSTRNTLSALNDNVIKPVTEGCKQLSYFPVTGFKSAPVLLASKRTRNGNNGGWLRRCSVTKTSVALINEEDMDRDAERGHVVEPFSYFLFDKPPTSEICELFPSPVQTWTGNSNALLKMKNNARISGAPYVNGKRYVGFPQSKITLENNASCDDEGCFGNEGLMIKRLELESFKTSSKEVVVDHQESKTFSSYEVLEKLEVKNNAKVTFKTGTYWIEELKVDNSAQINIPDSQKVQIHVKKLELKNNAKFYTVGKAELIIIGHGNDKITLDNSAELTGLLYTEASVELKNNAVVYGAVTARSISMDNSASIIATDNHCFTPSDDYEVTLSPAAQYALMCGTEQPSFAIETKNNGYAESTGVTVQVYPDADNFSIDVVESTGTGSYPSFTTSNVSSKLGKLKLQVSVKDQSSIDLDEEYTLKVTVDNDSSKTQTSTFKFVPFKFSADDQYVIAGKLKEVEVKAQACNDDNEVDDIDYDGKPDVLYQWVRPASGAVGSLTYSPSFSSGKSSKGLTLEDSGEMLVTLTDDNFTCSGDDCPIEGDGNTKTLKGQFTVYSRPWTFAICSPDDTNMDGSITDSSSAAFTAAGNSFELSVRPLRWVSDGDDSDPEDGTTEIEISGYCSSPVTQNFFIAGSAITSTVGLTHSVAEPDGGDDGSLSGTLVYSNSAGTNNTYLLYSRLSWSEVGVLKVTADTQANYLGMNVNPGYRDIGRFYPAWLSLVSNNWDYASDHDGFMYMSQPISYDFVVEAQNMDGEATTNYSSFSSDLIADVQLLAVDTDDNEDISDRVENYYLNYWDGSDSWSGSQLSVSNQSFQFNKSETNSSPLTTEADGPFTNGFGLLVADKVDDVDFLTSEDTNLELNDDIGKSFPTQPDIRYGRMAMDDVGGTSVSTINIPLRTEYWNGSRFITNTDDSASDYSSDEDYVCYQEVWSEASGSDGSLNGVTKTVDSGVNDELYATPYSEDYSSSIRQQLRFWLRMDDTSTTSPQTLETDYVTCGSSYMSQPWLQYNWRGKGDEDPSSVVTFGIHRGNDRVIYRGEPGLTGQ